MDNIILEITSGFVGLKAEKIDEAVDRALASLGCYCNVDRVYLFLYRNQHSRVDNTHEWCNEGVSREIDSLQDVCAQEELPWVNKAILALETLNIQDVSKLPSAAHLEKKIFDVQSIKALLVVPVSINEEVLGFLGFDSVKEKRKWNEHEINLLKILASNIGSLISRQRFESRLRESEEKFKILAETSPLAIYMSSGIEQKAEYINPSFVKLFGYTIDEVPTVEKWWPLAYPDEDYRNSITNEWQKKVQHAIETKSEIEPMEVVVTCKDGSTKNISWGFSAIGKQNWAFGLDLTNRKQAEKEREALIEQLQNKTEELERFTYTVSHDLKSPLITILGFVGILEKSLGERIDDDIRQSLDYINSAATKMSSLLDDLLRLSRIGRVINPNEPVELSSVAEEALTLIKGRLLEVKIIVKIGDDLPAVTGDRIRLCELMQNLLENAIKYMGEQPAPFIEVGVAEKDGERACFVRDNGQGIPERYHAKVFGLFERLSTDGEGTGIGLALVQRIIESHGGRIWVESTGVAGEGTTFWFTLPWEDVQTGTPTS